MTMPTKGIAVSYAATQNSHSRESLTFVVEHALNHGGYVGRWLDSENGQKAVYIISTGEEILVEEIRMAA
jgi:hypothetical protein